jgi:nucleoid-associated protein YgaU
MKLSKFIKKYFKSSEEVVSMFLGLVIVIVVVGLIFNFFQKRKGNINVPGVSDIKITEEDLKNNVDTKQDNDLYVVVVGDSLWKIAQNKYNNGYAWTEIAKANNLTNPYSLEVGQNLVLPKNIEKKDVITTNLQANTIATGEYKVVKNDNLWTIAVRSYGDGYQWTKIWQENHSKLSDPNRLEIGMLLTIPNLK